MENDSVLLSDSYRITQPSGTDLSYRGIIKSIAFRQEGGRPNQWFWTMEFQILQNEHNQGNQFMGQGVLEGILRINRIRLVNKETGAAITSFVGLSAGDACIEVRTSDELQVPYYDDDGILSGRYGKTIVAQNIVITNSNSVPKINGDWEIYDLDYSLKTFRLRNTYDVSFFARGNNQPNSEAAWTAFTDGSDGYMSAAFQHVSPNANDEERRKASGLQNEVMYLVSYNEQKAQEELWAENE